MITMTNIAESLAEMHDADLLRCDIQWNQIKRMLVAYVEIGKWEDDLTIAEYEIRSDGRFSRLEDVR